MQGQDIGAILTQKGLAPDTTRGPTHSNVHTLYVITRCSDGTEISVEYYASDHCEKYLVLK